MEKRKDRWVVYLHEVSSALEKMKIGKASRPSGVVAEIKKAEKEFGIDVGK